MVGGTLQIQSSPQFPRDFGVARFNSDGTLDTTFNGDGKASVSFVPEMLSSFNIEYFSKLKLTNDGKIVVAGFASDPGAFTRRFLVARLNTDGSLDMTFGTNGRIADTNTDAFLNDLIVLSDNSVVVAGLSNFSVSSGIAVKYNTSGSRDWLFNQAVAQPNSEGFYGIAAQPDGKLIGVGRRNYRVGAVRINANGTADTSFTSTPTLPSGRGISAAIQPDGKIIANYDFSPGNNSSFNLVRFNTNGSLDSGFGNGGRLETSAAEGMDYGNKVLIQPDGKILIGGYSQIGSPTRYYFRLMRYLGESASRNNPLFDYDGDGRADISVFRPSNGAWYIQQSTNGFIGVNFGLNSDLLVPADFDGDGKTDVAVFRPSNGTWYYLRSSNGTFSGVQWGQNGDVPIAGDYDGDGKADVNVFRPSNGYWYRLNSSNNQYVGNAFGQNGDVPLLGDFNGDGRDDLAVFRPSAGAWYIARATGVPAQNFDAITFGSATDKPVPADYDGDGKADVAVFRPSNGSWYRLNSSNGSFSGVAFGQNGDVPVPADYDGDGKADVSVFRPANGAWYQSLSTSGFSGQLFGFGSDLPVPGAYVP